MKSATRCRQRLSNGRLCGRPLGHPGSCRSVQSVRTKAAGSHAGEIRRRYGISQEEYWAIYEAQGGHCALCQRATGKTKKLAVDHDHAIANRRRSVRGLLCTLCNRILGHARDDPGFFERAISYLKEPPARAILADSEADERGTE